MVILFLSKDFHIKKKGYSRESRGAHLGDFLLDDKSIVTKPHKHTQRERFLRITHRAANHVRNAATITHIAKPPLPAFKVSQDGKMPT